MTASRRRRAGWSLVAVGVVAALALVGCRPAPAVGPGRVAAAPPSTAPASPVPLGPIASAVSAPLRTTAPPPRATAPPARPSASAPPAPAGSRRPVSRVAGKLVFSVGTELDGDLKAPVASGLGMFTNWYNGPGDLGFLRGFATNVIPQTYASGRAINLVVWLGGAGTSGPVSTRYGPACGRTYALSPDFLRDATELARLFAGPANGPPLYVSLFAEFQTYPCSTNSWAPSPEVTHYYEALKDQYRAALAIFHAQAPNARVSLDWGGWQASWDDPGHGGGRSLFGHFADVMGASDFQSFQAMDSSDNVTDITDMTDALGKYGPVLLSYYKPDSGSQSVWTADLTKVFTDSYIQQVTAAGLFGFGFMDQKNLTADAGSLALARNAIARYGVGPGRD